MPNEKNLIPANQRTPDERRRIAKKAGKASGEARRRKKAMKEMAEIVLSLKTSGSMREKMLEMGIAKSDCNNQAAMLIAAMAKALKGDIRAAEFIRDTAGENPAVVPPTAQIEDDPLTKSIYESVNDDVFR